MPSIPENVDNLYLSNNPNPIIIVNLNGELKYINLSCQKLLTSLGLEEHKNLRPTGQEKNDQHRKINGRGSQSQ